MDQPGNLALKLRINHKLREAAHLELVRQYGVDTEIDKLDLETRKKIEQMANSLQTAVLFHVMQGTPIVGPSCIECPDCGEAINVHKARVI